MPELPEVETVRRGLTKRLAGQPIASVVLNRPDLRFPFPPRMERRLKGRVIEAVDRRAKYLLLRCGPAPGKPRSPADPVVIVHLGMSGRMIFDEGGRPPEAHDHMILTAGDGTRLVYNDARRFGFVLMAEAGGLESHPRLAGLGPEPLGDDFTKAYLLDRLAGRMTTLKAALLDQKLVAGVGNIYACEALYQAGLLPTRLAASLGARQAGRLVAAVRDVLGRAIEAGGSSLRDYVQTDGELGYFQHAWAVYGKEGEPCPTCPGGRACKTGVRRITQSGRSTFYCHKCQR